MLSSPPATSTLPLGSSVAVCAARAVLRLPGGSPAAAERKGCVVEKQAESKRIRLTTARLSSGELPFCVPYDALNC
jgi:hypothetical protein